jgi:hypothetical protein
MSKPTWSLCLSRRVTTSVFCARSERRPAARGLADSDGYWYARSAEFLQSPQMHHLRWVRVTGDTVFFLGAVAW